MPLVPCRECGKSVSTEAPVCLRCGAPNPAPRAPAQRKRLPVTPEERRRQKYAIAVVLVLIIAGAWWRQYGEQFTRSWRKSPPDALHDTANDLAPIVDDSVVLDFMATRFCAEYGCRADRPIQLVNGGQLTNIDTEVDQVAIGIETAAGQLTSAAISFYDRLVADDGSHVPREGDRDFGRAFIRALTGSQCDIRDPFSGPRIRNPNARVIDLPSHPCGNWAVQYGHSYGSANIRVLPDAVNSQEMRHRRPIH